MEDPISPNHEAVSTGNSQTSRAETISDESLLIKARCEEKEGHFSEALRLYIQLKKEEDALRCSALKLKKNTEESRHKHNRLPIYVLTGSTFILICLFLYTLITFNNKEQKTIPPSVQWLNKGTVELTNYPSWFLYDRKNNKVSTRTNIDEKMKFDLQKYYPEHDSVNFISFKEAVDKLAFKSNDIGSDHYWLLLLLSGLAAVVGVLIREILDLIYHYCYENDLDFRMWWPWYLLRPIVGFMVGIIIVLFNGTSLLINSPDSQNETYLIAIAIIAGISVEDVMFKIRKISQVVFGDSTQSSSSGKSVAPKTDDKQNIANISETDPKSINAG